MRNPVGPLPSSIYWRRRAVVLSFVALLAVLIVWTVSFGGGGKRVNAANRNSGHTPATTITPGPTPSGTFNSSRPGGRVSGSDGGSDSGDGSSGAAAGGSGSTGQDTGGTGGAGGTEGAPSGGTPARLPAGSTLPDCTSSTVTIALRSVKDSYDTFDKPRFRLTATNRGSTACKLDFGATSAVFTIDDVDGKHIWASDDCPADRAAYLLQVPAGGGTTYTMTWDRRTSSAQCATPKGKTVPNGATYLVQAKLPGFAAQQRSFFLRGA